MTRKTSFLNRFLLWVLFCVAVQMPTVWAAPLRIFDPSEQVEYEIALDELAVDLPGKGYQREKIPAKRSFEALERGVRAKERDRERDRESFLVFYPPNQVRSENRGRILTNRVTLQVVPGTDVEDLVAHFGARIVGEPDYAPDFFILEAPGGLDAGLKLAEALRAEDSVLLAQPVFARQRNRRNAVVNDPLFPSQWHLSNTGQTEGTVGMDIKVSSVWGLYRGKGVLINVVDDGVESTHPDLLANTDAGLGYDYALGVSDASPRPDSSDEGADSHGTAVAGIIAAAGNNNLGGAGVAYEATLVPVRLLGGDITDQHEAGALSHRNDIIDISNNSWGGDDDGQTKGGAGPLVLQALQNGITTGRDGKGAIFVWAAGNGGLEGDNVNFDTYANSIYTIAVGALNDLGKKADYSEPGACLIVSAPAGFETNGREPGIVTTDLTGDLGYNRSDVFADLVDTNYTATFNGTSASAPVVSGVVALVLEANPNLGWRDVQEILILSATQQDELDTGWITNDAGLTFHHNYGSGLVNAAGAIELASKWRNLPPQASVSASEAVTVSIPDNAPAGVTRTFDFSGTNLRVEHVAVTATITHPSRGNLAISLVSPHGTVSRLSEPHADPNPNYDQFRFMSTFHWGEMSAGEWQVHIADLAPGGAGSVVGLEVEVFGTAPVLPKLGLVQSAENLTLVVDGHAGRLNVIEISEDLTGWTPFQEIFWMNGPYQVEVPKGARTRFYRVRIPPGK